MLVTVHSYACTLLIVIRPDIKVGIIGNSGRVFTVHSIVPFPKMVARHLVAARVDTVIVPNPEDAKQLWGEIAKLSDDAGRKMEILPFVGMALGVYGHAEGEDYVGALLLCMQFIEEWNHANSTNYSVEFAQELLLAHNEFCLNCIDKEAVRVSLLAGEFSDRGSVALELLVGFNDWCRLNNTGVFFQSCQEKIVSYVESLKTSKRKVAVVGTSLNRLFVNFLKLLLTELGDSQVIVPFVDLKLSSSRWQALDSSHYQYYVMRLLSALEVDREDIKYIGDCHNNTLATLLFNYELAGLHFAAGRGIETQNNVELMTFSAEGDESRKIVEILLQHSRNNRPDGGQTNMPETQPTGNMKFPGKSEREAVSAAGMDFYQSLDAPCVLFLGSDSLANRVRAELLVSGSALHTVDCCYMAHSLIMSVLEVINSGGEASKLLAALKHPMVSLELHDGDYAAVLSEFELSIIRESAASGFDMISKIVALSDGKVVGFWDKVIGAFSPLMQLKDTCTLEKISQEHFRCLEKLIDSERCNKGMLCDVAGTIHDFFSLLRGHCRQIRLFSMANYSSLVGEIAKYFFYNKGNDITSAFFSSGSVIMVSGFSEGEFTKLTRSFLLNDEVRSRLGLPTSEEYSGYFSYIMYGLLHAQKVYITRSEELCGQVREAPLMARYLDFLLSSFNCKTNGDVSTGQQGSSAGTIAIQEEAKVPNPPLQIRQEVFSELTSESVDVLLNNPFAFYARYILGIRSVSRIDVSSVAKSFSGTVRRILSKYLVQVGLSSDYCTLMDIAKKEFCAVSEHYPYVEDLWWPRFEQMAQGFFQADSKRKQDIAQISIGETFTWNVGQNIKVTSKCDRVEHRVDGGISVICHKVGAIPAQIDIRCGIASRGVIDSISVAEECSNTGDISFEYWKIAPEALEIMAIDGFTDILDNARAGIGDLLRVYSEEMVPFYPRVDFARLGEYELFSRIGEREMNLATRR